MNDRFFLDTNVFVYAFDRNAPNKAERAYKLIREAIDSRRGIISYQVAQEFFNVAFRRFAQPMMVAEAEQYLSTIFRRLMAVHSSHALLSEALRLKAKHQLSWFDSLIVAAAMEGKCAVLYSEDFQHDQHFGDLRVENPFL